MIDVSAFVDLRDVESGLRRMQMAGKDLRPLFKRVKSDMRADMRDHAKSEEGPSGKWPSLDPDTLAKRSRQGQGRRHRGKKKRRRKAFGKKLGRLPRAFAVTYSRSFIRATSRVKWSGAHQGGAIVGKGSRLPDRTFLWASSGLLQIVARKAVDYLVGAWDKS